MDTMPLISQSAHAAPGAGSPPVPLSEPLMSRDSVKVTSERLQHQRKELTRISADIEAASAAEAARAAKQRSELEKTIGSAQETVAVLSEVLETAQTQMRSGEVSSGSQQELLKQLRDESVFFRSQLLDILNDSQTSISNEMILGRALATTDHIDQVLEQYEHFARSRSNSDTSSHSWRSSSQPPPPPQLQQAVSPARHSLRGGVSQSSEVPSLQALGEPGGRPSISPRRIADVAGDDINLASAESLNSGGGGVRALHLTSQDELAHTKPSGPAGTRPLSNGHMASPRQHQPARLSSSSRTHQPASTMAALFSDESAPIVSESATSALLAQPLGGDGDIGHERLVTERASSGRLQEVLSRTGSLRKTIKSAIAKAPVIGPMLNPSQSANAGSPEVVSPTTLFAIEPSEDPAAWNSIDLLTEGVASQGMPRDVESGRSPRAQHGPALSPRSPAALGASHSVTSSLDTLARSGRRSAARAQRSPLPGMWLHALDPVVLLALFVLSGLFISEEGEPGHRRPTVPFEVYLWNSILNTFNWHSTLFDVVLLSTCRTLAATGLAGAARKHPALRSSVFLRTCLYVFVCLTLGLTLAKLVKLAQDSDAAHAGLPIPVPVTAFVVGVSLLFGVAEVVSLLHHLREWCEKLDYAALAEQQQEAETEAGEEASPDEVPVVRRIRWSRLGSLMYDDLNLILLGLAMLAFNSAIGLIIPLYFGKIVDSVTSSSGNLDMLKGVMVELCLWFIASGITGFARSLAFTLTGYRIVKNVRSQVFRAITMQEIAFFDESSTGELTSRLSSDAQVLQSALTVDLSMLLRFLAQAVGSIVILFSLSWKLTLVMFSCVPLIAIGAVIYGNYVSGMQEQFQDLLAETQTVAQEIISQIRTVRSFAKELRSQDKYNHAIEEAHRIGVRISVVQALFMGLTGFLPQIAIALVLYFGAVMIVNGEISGGLLTSFLLYTLALAMAFGVLSNLFGDFMQAVGASQRIFDLMDRVPIVPLSGGASIRDFRGKIEFKDVSFSYPTRKDAQILKGVSLTLEPGTVLALVGPSGQGKSTIMALILRFYDVDSGSIMIDDRLDIKVIDLQWFRSEIGYVSQEPVLFSGTIAENIAYGWHRQDRQPTLQEIIEAATQARSQHHAIKCRFANAHQFIDQFPDKYDTAVGERGVQLSGGQKQRIAIARAFLMNPKILLLGELLA
ncbi:hypothetical protein HK105_206973 [Polyrhizophydium stewartii]|uniref:Uncharacterized protein n=1 Tax=Polyrhizophydium stewartii TaxID=2732419 RepID=A0ABR4N1X2_9FUNG